MAVSTMTSKHQTTVPKEIRERLRLEPGAVLNWELEGGEVRITAERPAFFALRGSIPAGKGTAVANVRKARRLRGLRRW